MEELLAVIYLNNSACILASKGCMEEAVVVQTDAFLVASCVVSPQVILAQALGTQVAAVWEMGVQMSRQESRQEYCDCEGG